MTVSFKQFSTFLKRTEGDLTQDQIDEAWADIFRKKQDDQDKKDNDSKRELTPAEKKKKGMVLSAKERLELKKEEEKERKKELEKKRDAAWARAKDNAEGRGKETPYGRRDDYALHRMHEGKQSYSDEGYWKDDAKEAGYKVKKLSGDIMKGDQTWGAFDGDKKMGEFTEKEDGRGGWLITEGQDLNEAKAFAVLNACAKKLGETGFATMDEDDMAKLLDMRRANAAAKKAYGEFGLATCSEKDIRNLVNAHPEWLKGEAKKKFTAA